MMGDRHDVLEYISAANAKTNTRVEFCLDVALALLVGLVGALLIFWWVEGCDAGQLCSAGFALVTAANQPGAGAGPGAGEAQRLNEAVLDRRQAERLAMSTPLPALLLSTGAMVGPFRRTKPPAFFAFRVLHRIPIITARPWAQASKFFSNYRLYRSAGHPRHVAIRIAYGIAFLYLPF